MAAIKTAEMERDTWLQERSKGIGGSDVATVLGLNPYKTPLSLWEEKTGKTKGSPAGEAAYWGTTLEDVVAYKIALSDLIRLFQTNIELANWGRIIHQNEYRRLHRSHKDRLTLSAKERYEEFMQQFPQICQRVQLGYIASYLGITLPTLSRLRSRK